MGIITNQALQKEKKETSELEDIKIENVQSETHRKKDQKENEMSVSSRTVSSILCVIKSQKVAERKGFKEIVAEIFQM